MIYLRGGDVEYYRVRARYESAKLKKRARGTIVRSIYNMDWDVVLRPNIIAGFLTQRTC